MALGLMSHVHDHVLLHYQYPPHRTMCSCGNPSHASTTSECARSIQTATSWQIKHDLTMLLKHLASEDLGKEVSWVGLSWHVVYLHDTSAAQLTHLKQLARTPVPIFESVFDDQCVPV